MTGDTLRREILEMLLAEEPVVRVSFQVEGAAAPADLADAIGILNLDVGYNMPLPITGLELHPDEGLCGTFSFNREPRYVQVPWKNMLYYGCLDGNQHLRADMLIVFPQVTQEQLEPQPESKPSPRGLSLVPEEKN